MVDPVVVLSGTPGSSIALKATRCGPERVFEAFSQVVNHWLADRGASNLGAPSGLAELSQHELVGTAEELAESLIRAAAQSGIELGPCELDDTVVVVALVNCRPRAE